MQVSNNATQPLLQLYMNNNRDELGRLTLQMASGQRMLIPSDDPIGSLMLGRLQREDATRDQYSDNIKTLRSQLSKNEGLVRSISDRLLDVKDLLLEAANTPQSNENLQAIATDLEPLRDNILRTANTRDGQGHYLFSGTKITQPTILVGSGVGGSRYSFGGNEALQKVIVGDDITQTANVTLKPMVDLLNQLDMTIEILKKGNDPKLLAQIHNTLNETDSAYGAVNSRIAEMGGAQNFLEALDNSHDIVGLANKQRMIALGSLDYASAAAEMNNRETAVKASIKVWSQVSRLSLFDAL